MSNAKQPNVVDSILDFMRDGVNARRWWTPTDVEKRLDFPSHDVAVALRSLTASGHIDRAEPNDMCEAAYRVVPS